MNISHSFYDTNKNNTMYAKSGNAVDMLYFSLDHGQNIEYIIIYIMYK